MLDKLGLMVGIKFAPKAGVMEKVKIILKVIRLRLADLIALHHNLFLIGKREKVEMRGEFLIKQWRLINGKWQVMDARKVTNLIVNAGKAEAAALLGAIAGGAAFNHLAVGTGTIAPAATDTALGAEITTGGLARAASTNTQVTTTVTGDTLQMVKEWTATASHAVTEAGAFNAATAGDMLCRQTFAVINLVSGDRLEVTYKIQVS